MTTSQLSHYSLFVGILQVLYNLEFQLSRRRAFYSFWMLAYFPAFAVFQLRIISDIASSGFHLKFVDLFLPVCTNQSLKAWYDHLNREECCQASNPGEYSSFCELIPLPVSWQTFKLRGKDEMFYTLCHVEFCFSFC